MGGGVGRNLDVSVQAVVSDVGGATLEPLTEDLALTHIEVVIEVLDVPLRATARGTQQGTRL